MICIECRMKTESAKKVVLRGGGCVLGGTEGGCPPFLADPNNIVEVLSPSPALLLFAFFHIISFVKSAWPRQKTATPRQRRTSQGCFRGRAAAHSVLSTDRTAVGVSSANVFFKSELLEDCILRAE